MGDLFRELLYSRKNMASRELCAVLKVLSRTFHVIWEAHQILGKNGLLKIVLCTLKLFSFTFLGIIYYI